MTLSTTVAKTQALGPIGISGTIPINFKFLANGDLSVIESNTDGTSVVTYVLGVNYSLTGAGNPSGGTLTLITAVAAGKRVTITRVVALNQNTDYVEGDKFPAQAHEDALDKLTMILQQIDEELGRALTLPVQSNQAITLVLPNPVANRALMWNATADGVKNSDSDVNDIDASVAAAGVSAAAASGSATAAGVSAGNAATSEGNAGTSATTATAAKDAIISTLTNKSGGTLNQGDVVVHSTTTNSSVTTTTTQGDEDVIGTVDDSSIANDASGKIRHHGKGKVRLAGVATRGNYLRASTTAKKAEDAGATPVDGVFAVALQSGVLDDVVDAMIFRPLLAVTQLSTDDEGAIESAPGTPTAANPFVPTDQLPISKGADVNQRICRGMIGAGGSILEGSGFSVVNNGTGDNTITFSPAFSDRPAVAAMIVGEAGVGYVAVADTVAAANIRIRTRHNTTDSPTSVDFLFIAFGPA